MGANEQPHAAIDCNVRIMRDRSPVPKLEMTGCAKTNALDTALPLNCDGWPGVACDTVRRAAVLLRERGLIVTVYGRGTYMA
jgi:hypothetical protein